MKQRNQVICGGIFFAAALLLLLAGRWISGFSEWYAQRIFPLFPHSLGRLFAPLPFSLFEWLLVSLLGALCLRAGIVVFRLFWRRDRSLSHRLSRLLIHAWLALGAVALWFVLTCGLNYSRDSFAAHMDLEAAPASEADLLRLYEILSLQAADLAAALDQEPVFPASRRLEARAQAAMSALSQEHDSLISYFPPPKPIFFSRVMSRLNLAGVYACFTLEANYNRDMPAISIPFAMCHELAHLSGYAREDEANFVSYLACMRSEDAFFRYSAAQTGLRYVMNALVSVLSAEAYQDLFAALPARTQADFQELRQYWRQFDGPAASFSDKANDYYLKANAQRDGVRSYGRVVDLLAAYYQV